VTVADELQTAQIVRWRRPICPAASRETRAIVAPRARCGQRGREYIDCAAARWRTRALPPRDMPIGPRRAPHRAHGKRVQRSARALVPRACESCASNSGPTRSPLAHHPAIRGAIERIRRALFTGRRASSPCATRSTAAPSARSAPRGTRPTASVRALVRLPARGAERRRCARQGGGRQDGGGAAGVVQEKQASILRARSSLPRRRVCDERGALLIADEIQTGSANRQWFAVSTSRRRVPADIIALASRSGGIPWRASGARTWRIPAGVHSSTFAQSARLRAGRAVLRVLAKRSCPNAPNDWAHISSGMATSKRRSARSAARTDVASCAQSDARED